MKNKYQEVLDRVARIRFYESDAYYLGFYDDYNTLKDMCEKANKFDKGFCNPKQYGKIKIKAFKEILNLICDLKNSNEKYDDRTIDLIFNIIKKEKIERN